MTRVEPRGGERAVLPWSGPARLGSCRTWPPCHPAGGGEARRRAPARAGGHRGVSAASWLNRNASRSREFYRCGRGRRKPGRHSLSGSSGVLRGTIHRGTPGQGWAACGQGNLEPIGEWCRPAWAPLPGGGGGVFCRGCGEKNAVAGARCSVLVRWSVCGGRQKGKVVGKLGSRLPAPSRLGRCCALVSHFPQARQIIAI